MILLQRICKQLLLILSEIHLEISKPDPQKIYANKTKQQDTEFATNTDKLFFLLLLFISRKVHLVSYTS